MLVGTSCESAVCDCLGCGQQSDSQRSGVCKEEAAGNEVRVDNERTFDNNRTEVYTTCCLICCQAPALICRQSKMVAGLLATLEELESLNKALYQAS